MFTKYFLSCGDWSVRVWSEDIRTPLVVSPYQPSALTAARWSPIRWERLFKTSLPTLLTVELQQVGCTRVLCCAAMRQQNPLSLPTLALRLHRRPLKPHQVEGPSQYLLFPFSIA